MISCTINGKELAVPEGTSILEAARQNGIDIPTLCYLKKINETGSELSDISSKLKNSIKEIGNEIDLFKV